MNIGIVGLGKMGNAIAFRLLEAGHNVIGYDRGEEPQKLAGQMGVTLADDLADLAKQTRVIWLMIPISAVDAVVDELKPHLKANDIIIDGGNSYYEDSMRRAKAVATDGIIFLDCGTSGGIAGRLGGFCLMVGGDEAAYTKIHSLLVAIAAPGGLGHVGPSGTGHYVKMIHNGIEYGLLQAYAEGFQIIKEGTFKKMGLDLEEISRIWNEGSIIRSFLLGLAHEVFEEGQALSDVSGEIAEGGTGKWTVQEAKKHHLSVPVIENALKVRAWSRESGGDYATKVIAMLRHKFGGHEVKRKKG
ncbi:decarboxylating 6-phosphogluconate dehydrogenase [Candidatus Dependentiae bacterium]|nr:MAG: decarboxylating 6-phosphogluconate dehydrogenase [Candidatus Dependentiae bacterium]